MELSELGLIGNCQIAALVHHSGAIVWACMPQFDSPPVFGSLIDEANGGQFLIGAADGHPGKQSYIENTNVLETRFECADGVFRVIDFAPRFYQNGRSFRPAMLIRIVEPISGSPRIRTVCSPVLGWSQQAPARELGSHHVEYLGYPARLRLTTDAPLSFLNGEAFALTGKKYFVMSWGAPVEEAIEPLCDRFFRETTRYWQRWVKHCNIPPMYQRQVIRSALVLKLHCFEDTGAIVAALTTSLPESPGSGRTWDYRYCWLRDSYYVLSALRLLGQFEEREQFLEYLLNIAASTPDLNLAPLYRIDTGQNLSEEILPHWAGFQGDGPVRIGNGAALHQQHDVYGEMVLALAPMFLDERFRAQATEQVVELLVLLARKAISLTGTPDAGIWELRTEWQPQTFSSLMCWAAADRAGRILEGRRPADAEQFRQSAERIRSEILSRATDSKRGNLVAEYSGTEVDSSLLQASMLEFLPRDSPVIRATLQAVSDDLHLGAWLRRYRVNDGFGVPEVAFMLCNFWRVEALARAGDIDAAQRMMKTIDLVDSPLGLLAEDINPMNNKMWGNFPQAYSHVGYIHAAFAASPSWTDWGL